MKASLVSDAAMGTSVSGICGWMSVAGNLRDLALTELLQTIALSRKSGVLEICSPDEVAWLGLREGGIVRVAVSDRQLSRKDLLQKADLDEDSPSDAIEACLWEAAVSAILALFDWAEGEFTFNPDEDPGEVWRGPEGLTLPTSLSPEFLALEGARIEDEGGGEVDDADVDDAFALDLTSEEPEPEPEPELPPVLRAEPTPVLLPDIPEAAPVRPELPHDPVLVLEAPMERVTEPAPAQDPNDSTHQASLHPIVVVDPELPVLELVKEMLAPTGVPIHIFPHSGDGLERIKHYVVRGVVPTLIVGCDVRDTETRGDGGWEDFAGRVRRMAPNMRIVLLGRGRGAGAADAEVRRVVVHEASASQTQEFRVALGAAIVGSA